MTPASSRRPPTAPPPVVALLIETSNAFSRELLHGIRDWMRTHRRWTIHLSEQGRGSAPPAWLKGWRGDGIIARLETPVIVKAVQTCRVPVVNVSAVGLAPAWPAVISESEGIARLAAHHLLERGFRHFAFVGCGQFIWSRRHGENFRHVIHGHGHSCDLYHTKDDIHTPRGIEHMARWLHALPKPVGVFACYDIMGQSVLDVCRAAAIRVPDEVAVIGQHNDELLCDLCDPPLSSVRPDARKVGWEAAQILEHSMRDQAHRAPLITLIPPLGVVTRHSTDHIAVENPGLATGMRYLKAHACEPISVEAIAKAAGMSRSLFERQFRQEFGDSPWEIVLRQRIEKAEQLLLTTSLPILDIAQKTGLGTAAHLSVMCKKYTGLPPATLRRQRRA